MAATISPRASSARSSLVSPAPSDCAVKPTVPMRRKANSQNMQSKITEAIATPPSSAGSPSRPIAVVETMPIKGVVRLAIIAGPAMAKTCVVVTLVGGASTSLVAAAWRSENPRQQEHRDDDHRTEQEIAPEPVDDIEAQIPNA